MRCCLPRWVLLKRSSQVRITKYFCFLGTITNSAQAAANVATRAGRHQGKPVNIQNSRAEGGSFSWTAAVDASVHWGHCISPRMPKSPLELMYTGWGEAYFSSPNYSKDNEDNATMDGTPESTAVDSVKYRSTTLRRKSNPDMRTASAVTKAGTPKRSHLATVTAWCMNQSPGLGAAMWPRSGHREGN